MGNFEGCPACRKVLAVSALVYAGKAIIQYWITAWQPTSVLWTGWCHITLSP